MNEVWQYLRPSTLAIILAEDVLPVHLEVQAKKQLAACIGEKQATMIVLKVKRENHTFWNGIPF